MRVLMFPGPAHTPHTYSCASNGCRQRTVACRKVRRVWCSVWLGGLTRGGQDFELGAHSDFPLGRIRNGLGGEQRRPCLPPGSRLLSCR